MKKITFLATLLIAMPAVADLRQQIESKSGWVGYSVPISGHSLVCSYDDWESTTISNDSYHQQSTALYVLYHVANGHIESVRLSSPECGPLSRSVVWLDGVQSADSARLLRSLIEGDDRSLAKKAITPFALHVGTLDGLIDIAKHNPSTKMRGQALFWISQAAGARAAATLKDAIENDPAEEVKTKAVFGISQLPDDQSIPMLVDLIKTNRSAAVRKKAAFWLGQKNDPRALAALEEILRR